MCSGVCLIRSTFFFFRFLLLFASFCCCFFSCVCFYACVCRCRFSWCVCSRPLASCVFLHLLVASCVSALHVVASCVFPHSFTSRVFLLLFVSPRVPCCSCVFLFSACVAVSALSCVCFCVISSCVALLLRFVCVLLPFFLRASSLFFRVCFCLATAVEERNCASGRGKGRRYFHSRASRKEHSADRHGPQVEGKNEKRRRILRPTNTRPCTRLFNS